MAFYGCQFIFNEIPCFEYGLMVYDIESSEEDGKFTSAPEILEDRTYRRYTPLHYGTTQKNPLVFDFTFGTSIDSIDKDKPIDRYEMEAIATWLTEHDTYKYLEIIQPDMEIIRYKCIITNLEYITYGKFPWAFRCTVTCDSPYAYSYPEVTKINISNKADTVIECRASCKYYYPKLIINKGQGSNSNSLSIINHSDNDREFCLTNIPSGVGEIIIDNENEIITNSANLNIYDSFNFNYLRLVRGYNNLEFTGVANVSIECEFPINIGG